MPTSPDIEPRLHALSESRERWRSLVQLGADFAFETDEAGRFSIVSPDPALGWAAGQLIGTCADSLLVTSKATNNAVFNPFRVTAPLRRRRVWLRDADGAASCLLLSVAPIAGKPGCVHGLGIDMTVQDRHDAQAAAALLRLQTTRMIARRMRSVPAPFASLGVALSELLHAAGARGAMLVLHNPDMKLRVAARSGQPWPGPIEALNDAILESCETPAAWSGEETGQSLLYGQSLLLCGGPNHFIDRAILAVWRENAPWSEDEAALLTSLLPTIQPVLEHEQIQRETARQSRVDILTGLFNRQGFVAELARRFERLDREGLPATLMVVGLDGLGRINAAYGLHAGDSLLRDAAAVLRDGVRPTDLAGRLGGDLFALWLDGADQFAAAERAESLSRAGIASEEADGGRLGISIGLAVRSSRSFESIESLLHRGWRAMRRSKLAGGGGWQNSDEEPTP